MEEAVAKAFNVPADAVRSANLLLGSIGETARFAAENRLGDATIQSFRPVKFMLASPEETAGDIWARLIDTKAGEKVGRGESEQNGADPEVAQPHRAVWLEDKYDGVRCQLHKVGSRVALDVQSEQPLPEILCDVGELDLALLNLVINARDAMAGSGRIGVRIYPCHAESEAPKASIGKPARFVCLTVKDDGPGMTKEVRQRALEPFYTTKGEAGNGLGLSQVYGFMQQLGGQMIIDSTPGHGTAVHLFFPVAPDVGVKS